MFLEYAVSLQEQLIEDEERKNTSDNFMNSIRFIQATRYYNQGLGFKMKLGSLIKQKEYHD